MLVFTPEVNEVLRWFQLTHREQHDGFGPPRWVRTEWLHPGAAGEQDARLTSALEHVCRVMNEVAGEGKDDVAAREELAAFRRKHGRNRR